jgi:hypothetical protein
MPARTVHLVLALKLEADALEAGLVIGIEHDVVVV